MVTKHKQKNELTPQHYHGDVPTLTLNGNANNYMYFRQVTHSWEHRIFLGGIYNAHTDTRISYFNTVCLRETVSYVNM